VFPVRYELNSYILFRRNFVFKGLKGDIGKVCKEVKRKKTIVMGCDAV
jgi:hypothetical protein